jgi:Rrf2 family transcriptional regulator, cysteine metabolism repressor
MRALLELSMRDPSGPVMTVAEIAKIQKIPVRFLEQIFSKLRTGGYIASKRGKQGGYVMAVSPSNLSVGEIIRFIEGGEESVDCLKTRQADHCAFGTGCAFKQLWTRARDAMSAIFDEMTFQDLVNKQNSLKTEINYSI